MISVTGNTKERITAQDLSGGSTYEILKDGVKWLSGSGILVPIIWNNMIGTNWESKQEHQDYITRIEAFNGEYAFRDVKAKKIIDQCTITRG